MASEVRISCISPTLREALLKGVELLGDDETMKEVTERVLKAIPACPLGETIGISTVEVSDVPIAADTEKKKKRKPSAYNNFTGDCMRGGQKTMAECAAEWKLLKT